MLETSQEQGLQEGEGSGGADLYLSPLEAEARGFKPRSQPRPCTKTIFSD